MKKKVLIIGAGPAGLSAAYYLLKNKSDKINVIVLEKDSVVGGISKTIDMDGYKIDIGGHRFFTKNSEVENLWKELLIVQNKPAYDEILYELKKTYGSTGSNPEIDDRSLLIRERVSRIYYKNKFYDYPVVINFKTVSNLGFINTIKVGFSYLKSCIHKLPETSLENFYINRFGKELYNMFFKSYTEKVWGIDPKKISADWGRQRVKGLSITKVILNIITKNKEKETSLIESYMYPKFGVGQMYKEMQYKIEKMGGKIIFNSEVKKIICEKNHIKKIKYIEKNKEKIMDVDFVVSSMPIKELFESLDGIKIPNSTYDIATNLPYRNFMSVGFLVDNFKLKNSSSKKNIKPFISDCWIYLQDSNLKAGRLQILNNWSPYMLKDKKEIKNKVLCSLEYFSSDNDKYWKMNDEDFIKFATKEAEKLNLFDKKNILKTIRIKVDKAYPAYHGVYKDFDEVKNFLDNIENLFCVGRNGQHRYNNMDHSILTGFEAAKLIINNDYNKEKLWNINIEKEYHESIKK